MRKNVHEVDLTPFSIYQTLKPEMWGNPRQKAKITLDTGGNAIEIFTHDEYGVCIDPKVWAGKKAKSCCEGRGFFWKYTTRVEREVVGGRAYEAKKPHREMHPCPCAMDRYQKFRKKIEDRLLKVSKAGGDVAKELEKIHLENGHTIRIEVLPEPEPETIITPP